MLVAKEITPINTSKSIYFECSNCGMNATMCLTNNIVNTDNDGKIIDGQSWNCPKCGKDLR